MALLLAAQLSGCGGWIRSRLPDPNAKAEEQNAVGESVPKAEDPVAGVVAPSESTTPATVETHGAPVVLEGNEPAWEMPAEPARELKWGFYRGSSVDYTLPGSSDSDRVVKFLDGTKWSTLSENSESFATGLLAGTRSDLVDPMSLDPAVQPVAPLHLVLNSAFHGLAIVDALYELEIRDDLNRPVMKRERHLARHDPRGAKWFVPLYEIVGEGAVNWVSPLHRVRVRWLLELDNGRRLEVSTTFRLRLPPPQLRRVGLRRFSELMTAAAHDTQTHSRIMQEEIWDNPTQREMDLWVRAWSANLGEVHEIQQRIPEVKHRNRPDIIWKTSNWRSSASFALGQVVVQGGNLIQSPGQDSEGQWIRIRLAPGATTQISWHGRVVGADFPPGCALHRKQTVGLLWYEPYMWGPPGEREVRYHRRMVRRDIEWLPISHHAQGAVSSEAWVTESAPSENEIPPVNRQSWDPTHLWGGDQVVTFSGRATWDLGLSRYNSLPVWGCNQGHPAN